MSVRICIQNWRVTLRIALVLAALLLCLLCVLGGVRPSCLSELYLVRVTAFHDALENLVHTIPVFGNVVDAALDKVFEKTDVPHSISIYAASYCNLSYGANGTAKSECFLHKSTFFDIAAGLRVYIALFYVLGVISSAASLLFLGQMMRKDIPHYRNWAALFTLLAACAIAIASLITSMLACAVYMVFSSNLPKSLLSVTIGPSFLACTWLAVACLLLVFSSIMPRMWSPVE